MVSGKVQSGNFQNRLEKVVVFCLGVSIFLFYSYYFIYIYQTHYLSLCIVISALSAVANKEYIIRFFSTTSFFLLLTFFIFLFLGLYITPAPEYGKMKFYVTISWIFLYMLSLPSIVKNLDFFWYTNILFGILFMVLLISEYGNPLFYLTEVAKNGIRLGNEIEKEELTLNPIWVARYLSFTILAVLLVVPNKGFYLIVKTSFCFLAALFVLASASKGPIVSLLVSVFFSFHQKIIEKKYKIFVVSILGLFIAFSLFENTNLENNFFAERFSLGSESSDERLEFQKKAVSNLDISTFIFGAGTGAGGFLLGGYDERYYPHNVLVEVLYENGIFTTIVILLLFGRKLKEGFSLSFFKNRSLRLAFAALIFFVLNAQFSGDLMSNQFSFLFLFVVAFYTKFTKIL